MGNWLAIVGCGFWLLAAPALEAQTTLRWKLQTGDHLDVAITQNTTSEVLYSGKKTAAKIDLAMYLTWRVLAVEENKFRLEQTLDRVTVSLAAPPAGEVQYDTAQAAKPVGSAKDIAAALAPLIAAKLEVTMSDRGEVLGAKPVQPAAAAGPSAGQPPLFSKDAIQQLLKQPLVVLPDAPVSPGTKWPIKTELTTALGKATQTTEYQFKGPVQEGGQKLDQIAFTAALEIADNAAAKIKLKKQEQSGKIRFDSAAGRVVSAEQEQTLVTERPYRETMIVVSLATKQKTTVTPTKQVEGGQK